MSAVHLSRVSLRVRGVDAARVEAALAALPSALERHLDGDRARGTGPAHPPQGAAPGPASLRFDAPPDAAELAEALADLLARRMPAPRPPHIDPPRSDP